MQREAIVEYTVKYKAKIVLDTGDDDIEAQISTLRKTCMAVTYSMDTDHNPNRFKRLIRNNEALGNFHELPIPEEKHNGPVNCDYISDSLEVVKVVFVNKTNDT